MFLWAGMMHSHNIYTHDVTIMEGAGHSVMDVGNEGFYLEQELSQRNSQLKIGKKDNLWKLFYYEKGLLDIPAGKKVISGCPCGYTSLCILSDGSLFICRRFYAKIGL
jgi:hypothetical protein